MRKFVFLSKRANTFQHEMYKNGKFFNKHSIIFYILVRTSQSFSIKGSYFHWTFIHSISISPKTLASFFLRYILTQIVTDLQ